jgi:hypothetical protein
MDQPMDVALMQFAYTQVLMSVQGLHYSSIYFAMKPG